MPSPVPDNPLPPLPEALQQAATEALGQPPPRRAVAMRELETAHPRHAQALRRLEADLAATERLLRSSYPAADELPDRLGPFRVLKRLGDGAFGQVFLCEQEAPVRRQVAVKVLRPGAGDRTTLDRFASERQVVASLQHPTIAQVFDAGTLDDGRPYFVMDAIDGVPIGEYCDRKAMPIGARLALFLDLCRGVQHAHSRGIVHRDLKPANVLVVEHEGRPLPRIIDFGIAKVLLGGHESRPFATEAGRVVGTPGYMSPEQASGRSDEVDARADVFALGVMLYELLCGQRPWGDLARTPDSDPPRPSQQIATRRDTAAAIATRRASEPRRLASELRGDLDWIVQKCLQFDRRDRYESVPELIDDVERHVGGRPVRAGPPSVSYRLRKFARRHRSVLLFAAGTAAMLAIGTAISLRLREQASASEARRLEDSLHAAERLFARANDPMLQHAPRQDELRRELMQDALQVHERAMRGDAAAPHQRALRLRILSALADMHYVLGQAPEGQQIAEQAVEQANLLVDADPGSQEHRAGRARALRNLARLTQLRGDHDRAAEFFGRAVLEFEQLRAQRPLDHANLLAKSLTEQALTLNRIGDLDGQLAAQQRAIEVLTEDLRDHPDDDETQRDLVRFHCGLANIHRKRDDLGQALETLAKAQQLAATLPLVTAEEHALVGNRLGTVHESRGDVAAAIAAFEHAAQLLGPMLERDPGRHQLRLTFVNIEGSLTRLQGQLGDMDRALEHARAAVAGIDGLAAGSEGRTSHIVDTLLAVGEVLVAAADPATADTADGWLQRASELAQDLPASAPHTPALRLKAAMLFARARSLRHRPLPPGTWQHNLELARTAADPGAELECLLQLVRELRGDRDFARARSTLAAARELLHSHATPSSHGDDRASLGRLAWLLESDAGDAAAVVAAVEDLLTDATGWQHLHHGADGYRAAAVLARRAGDPAAASRHERRSMELYGELARDGASPDADADGRLRSLSAAQARLHLAAAAAAGDAAALQTRRDSLQVLAALRHRTPASWWDESLWREAHAALVAAELRAGRVAEAMTCAERLAAEPCELEALLLATDLWAECTRSAAAAAAPDPALVRRGEEGATGTLERALARGAGRAQVLALAGLPLLESLPRGRELLAKLPP